MQYVEIFNIVTQLKIIPILSPQFMKMFPVMRSWDTMPGGVTHTALYLHITSKLEEAE